MPPSGFSRNAVQGIRTFLMRTFEDLNEEVRAGKHKSLQSGLTFELNQIRQALTQDPARGARASLDLIAAAYELALAYLTAGEAHPEELATNEVCDLIERIHIEDDGTLILSSLS